MFLLPLILELSPFPKMLWFIISSYPLPSIFTLESPVTPICEAVVAFAPP